MPDYEKREEHAGGGTSASTTTDALLEPIGPSAAQGQSAELNGQTTPQGAAEAASQQQAAEAAAEAERVARAKVEWEQLLGEKLGAKLFDLVREHLSYDDLLGHAQKGTQAMSDALGGVVKPTKPGALGGALDEKAEADALNKLIGAFAPKLKELADGWLQGESGRKVLTAVSQWVEENPEAVVAIVGAAAIGAAAAAWFSNMNPGEFEKSFNLGKHFAVGGSVDVGPLQDLVVEAASVSVKYQTDGLSVSLTGKHDAKDGNSVTASASASGKLGETEAEAKGDVTVHDDGRTSIKVNGDLRSIIGGLPVSMGGGVQHSGGGEQDAQTKIMGNIAVGEQGDQQTLDGWYDPGSRAFGFNLTRTMLDGMGTVTHGVQTDADGNTSTTRGAQIKTQDGQQLGITDETGPKGDGAEVTYRGENVAGTNADVRARAGTGTKEGFSLGVGYDLGRFRNELDLEMSNSSRTLGLGTQGKVGENTTLSANAKYDFDLGRFTELGAKLGWQDPEAFKSFMLEYRGRWLQDNPGYSHGVDMALEYSLGNLAGRLKGGVDLQNNQVSNANADLLMGYRVAPNHSILAGARYDMTTQNGQQNHQVGARVGYQYKDIAVTLGYKPGKDNQFSIGLEIPLRW